MRKQESILIRPFINKYKWEGITFPSGKEILKKFEEINVTIALNVLQAKKEKIYRALLILLMIPNGEASRAKSEQPWD